MATRDTGRMDGMSRELAEHWLEAQAERLRVLVPYTGHSYDVFAHLGGTHPHVTAICMECNDVLMLTCIGRGVDDYYPRTYRGAGCPIDIASHERTLDQSIHRGLGYGDDTPF